MKDNVSYIFFNSLNYSMIHMKDNVSYYHSYTKQ